MTAASTAPANALLDRARAILPDLIPIRRAVHRHPELGLDLPETQRRIAAELVALGLEHVEDLWRDLDQALAKAGGR